MTSKIRVKMGDIEVDYEGADDFLKKDLLGLLKNMSEIKPVEVSTSDKGGEGKGSSGGTTRSTTNFFAHKIGANKGCDLILAACYHIAIKGKESFTSNEILDEMRTASAYYKKSYANNLSSYLKTLSKSGQLNECGNGKYSLSPSELEKARALIKS